MPILKTIRGRYEIKAKLGEGGMGVVYRCYDPPPMNRDVALKTLLQFPDKMSLQLFYRECEVMKTLAHPNIVEIFDIGEFEDEGQKKPFFVMPLLPGHTLHDLVLSGSQRLSVQRVVDIITQTCRGLQAAHDRGLIHRDLKPSNIFVMADDSVKIIDFGVAHAVDSRTRTGGQKGTLLYMAPEQLQYQPASAQSDIFSLGVVCYEALTRRQPFRGTTEEEIVNSILKQVPPPASDINPAVNQMISRVVHKAMAKQPWKRFDSAREFGECLQKALRNEPIELFNPAKIQPRIERATKALEVDPQFASEIVAELEAEGHIDPQISLLRNQIDKVIRQRTLAQLIETAKARYEEGEDPLALQKIHEILQLDENNAIALGLRSNIEQRRNKNQIEQWIQLAQQHKDNRSYAHAREALQNVMKLPLKDTRANRMMSEIEADEQEYIRLRQEKAKVYQGALNAWKNGDVSGALTQMRLVLELDSKAPDTSSPELSGTYQTFYNKVRSEYDTLNNGYAAARALVEKHEFAKALAICDEILAKHPGQPLFQALKFDMSAQQGRQLSAFIADIDQKLEAEPDLDAKVGLLEGALAKYPDEDHFKKALKLTSDKRDLVKSIVARAWIREERGQIIEALSDYEIIRTIYSLYPGLQFEIERLQKRREQQAADEAKASWKYQVDSQLERGNYTRAMELLRNAEAEFPKDEDFAALKELSQQKLDDATEAEKLLVKGRDLCAGNSFEEGLKVLKRAHQLDDRNLSISTTLTDVLVEQARKTVERDWRSADGLAEQALELDPGNKLAMNIRAQVAARKREESNSQAATIASATSMFGSPQAAVGSGASVDPSEVDRTLLDVPEKNSQKKQNRSALEQLKGFRKKAEAMTDRGEMNSIFQRTRDIAGRYPDDADVQSVFRDFERTVAARGVGGAVQKDDKKKTTDQAATALAGIYPKLLLFLSPPRVFWIGAGILGILLVAFAGRHFSRKVSVAAIPVRIHTLPEGATIRVDNKGSGVSNLALNLEPGTYHVVASLAGYDALDTTITVKPGAATDYPLSLAAATQPLRVTTPDFPSGQVALDGNPVGNLESGSFLLPKVTAGPHVLSITGTESNGQEAKVSFQSTVGAMPVVSQPLESNQLQTIVVSTRPGTARIVSSLAPIAASVDDKAAGQVGADGLEVSDLPPGVHTLVLGEGKDLRSMSFEVGTAPALDTIVYADREVGSIVVLANEDDADVSVDGQRYPRRTRTGGLIIPDLPTASHIIRVSKVGFSTETRKIAVVRGQEARIQFALKAKNTPSKPATLAIDHMAPSTQILIDNVPLGTIGGDGTLVNPFIVPGNHFLVAVVQGHRSGHLPKTFVSGQTVSLSSPVFPPPEATLQVAVGANTAVTVMQNNSIIRQFTGPQRLTLGIGTYVITARDQDGTETKESYYLAPDGVATFPVSKARN